MSYPHPSLSFLYLSLFRNALCHFYISLYHSRESGNSQTRFAPAWISAFAGVTEGVAGMAGSDMGVTEGAAGIAGSGVGMIEGDEGVTGSNVGVTEALRK